MLVAEAVFQIELHEQVVEGHAVVLGPCSYLADEADGGWSVLVAHFVVGQEAEALLSSAYELLLALAYGYLASNPLEAGIAVAQLHVVLFGHLGNELCGHDGLHQEVGGLQLVERLLVADDVVAEHCAGLVTVDDHPFSLVVTAHDGQSVGVGVGCHHQVSVESGAHLHAQCHGLGVLRVGAHHSGEVAVNDHLLGYHVYVLESP